jgi:hypothetical protein
MLVALGVLVGAVLTVSPDSSSISVDAGPLVMGAPRVQVLYGHIRSLARKGARYELRFDPAFWLGGETARRAAVEDGVLAPGEPVPNDYYVVEAGHRPLTYLVPPTARVTVVTRQPGGIGSTSIRVSELAQIVKGGNPRRRSLFGRDLGYWIRVRTDTVQRLDQQYQP